MALAVHGLGSGWFRKVELGFATLACRRAFSVVHGILALALQAAPLSKVVWARDMGEPQNLELIRYFKDRKLWLVEPDAISPRLSVYPMVQVTSRSDTGTYRSSSDERKLQ